MKLEVGSQPRRYFCFLSIFLLVLTSLSSAYAESRNDQRSKSIKRVQHAKKVQSIGVRRSNLGKIDPTKVDLIPGCGYTKSNQKKLIGNLQIRKKRAPASAAQSLAFDTSAVVGIETVRDAGPPKNRLDIVVMGDAFNASSLPKFRQTTTDIMHVLFNTSPFKEYAAYINVHRIDLNSGSARIGCSTGDTPLGMWLNCAPGSRTILDNDQKANALAMLAPGYDKRLSIANTFDYRGTASVGGHYAGITLNLSAYVAVHEFGHSIGALMDEYQSDGGESYSGPELPFANLSIYKADQMLARNTKWAPWLSMPGHGTFEGGAGGIARGIYRPDFNSVMRQNGGIFNAPSRESLIMKFYEYVSPIEEASPAPATDGTYLSANQNFSVRTIAPTNAEIALRWKLDGVVIEGATSSYFNPENVLPDSLPHTLEVTATDMSPWVRDEYRKKHLSKSVSWQIRSNVERPLTFINDLPESTVVPPGTCLSFNVNVTGGAVSGITYYWFKNNQALPDTGSENWFSLCDASANNAGTYHVVARSGNQEVRSRDCIVEVRQKRNFTLSGRVLDSQNRPVEGVGTGLLSGSDLVWTDQNGAFSVSLPEGAYTLTPFKQGHTFAPATVAVNLNQNIVQNFLDVTDGNASRFVLSGYVRTANGTPLQGVTLNSHSSLGSVVTDVQGYFEFAAASAGLHYELEPSLANHTFTPSMISGDLNANTVTIFTRVGVASLWQNPVNRLDVNNDTLVAPIDALIIINELNARGEHELMGEAPIGRYLDVDGDNWVTRNDVEILFEYLNQ